ncbi:MAG: peptidoglycan D,D-transpeptidase FtsI family protein [Candidatus Roizmanbacteria bacterium]
MNSKRLHILFLLLVGFLGLIVIKLFYIQAFQTNAYSASRYLRTDRIAPKRGEIFDKSNQPWVINQTLYKLYSEPQKVTDKEHVIQKLDSILSIGEATLEAKLDTKKQWVSIIDGVTEKQKVSIEKLSLKGIGFESYDNRYYPEASLSAHILGFVGKTDKGRQIGYSGLEGYYEKDLAGLPGLVKTERDILGKPIIVGIQEKVAGENGRDLYLTIDKTAQKIVKDTLKAGIDRYGAKSGCVIAQNPKTGEIKAFSCLPDFDPSDYGSYTEDVFKNQGVSSLFEPGSIFKPLVMAAAINDKAIKVDDTYDENGSVTIDGYEINNWDDTYKGKISMSDIIEKSSNVGMVYVGSKMKKENLIDYLQKYGFSDKTGIDLQGEVTGSLRPVKSWKKIELATVTFGQGIVVTPIQMISAFSSVVNGGYLMKPYVVAAMASEDGIKKEINPKIIRRILTQKTSDSMKEILLKAVKHGEVKWKIPTGYKVGGKTGTAQIAVSGSYDASKTTASFVGFTPIDDPELIMMVTLKEPTSSPWGSETAAPLFFEILKDLLVYYNMPAR